MPAHVRLVTATVLCVLFGSSTSARAVDPVMEWNAIALAATVATTPPQGPIPQARTMTIVHVAVHDAVNTITREFQTYLLAGPQPAGASPEAAAIAAAHRVLATLFTNQASTLDPLRAQSLAAQGLTETNPGIAVGERVALEILGRAASDGFAQAQVPYTAPGAGSPGVWVAIGSAAPLLPGLGDVMPWLLLHGLAVSAGRPTIAGEPPLRDCDFNEVKELGALNSPTRTAEQTSIAQFWLATPSNIWNNVARTETAANHQGLSGNARVFALLYLATSDAAIACWDAKYAYDSGARSRPSGTPMLTATTTRRAIRTGSQWGQRRSIRIHAIRATRPTARRWPPSWASSLATSQGLRLSLTSSTNPSFTRQWTALSEGVEEVIDDVSIPASTTGRPTKWARDSDVRSPGSWMHHALGPWHGRKDKQ